MTFPTYLPGQFILFPGTLPTFLPGKLIATPGTFADYHALSRFHYHLNKPATVAAVSCIRYIDRKQRNPTQLAAVGVLSWPVPCCRERNLVFGLSDLSYGEKLAFANRELRTISRVIVHPVFRAAGLATHLVRHLCAQCPTRYVEALAMMGRIHPFFERAGLRRVVPDDPRRPVYFYAATGAPLAMPGVVAPQPRGSCDLLAA